MLEQQELKILLLDDDEDDFIIVKDMLDELEAKLVVDWEPEFSNALMNLQNNGYDLCLVDYRLGEHTGLEFIKSVREIDEYIPLILLTGQGDKSIDYEAMRLGASDYLVKGDFDEVAIWRSIRYAVTHSRAVIQLHENEIKYRSLFEQSVDAIYVLDNDLDFVDINDSLLQLLACPRDEIIGSPIEHIFFKEEGFQDFYRTIKVNGIIKSWEVELVSKSSDKLTCMINGIALRDNNNEIYGYQGIIHDISHRKRAEQELLIAEKLGMTGQIARSIAHEVRNPLTNLNLAMEQLKDEIADIDDAAIFADIIKRNAYRIEQLITEMLNSSKPQELKFQPEQINDVMEESLKIGFDRMKLRNIELVKDYEEGLPTVLIDKEQIKIAFTNIIINAIEAMDTGEGVLKISTIQKNDMVRVCIEDNGKGIPEEEVQKLFDPFFTGKSGGMGLGLTTTKNILNGHNAQVHVTTKEGEGTTFVIGFPVENQNE